MKYIIMCSGRYEQWRYPKQLSMIHGETLIQRTIRLLTENAVKKKDIKLTVTPELRDILLKDGLPVSVIPRVKELWVDCFYPMNAPCTYLYGDVVYSPNAIKMIVETETDDIEFFASAPPFAKNYSKKWAEPFAFKVVNQSVFKEAIEIAKDLHLNQHLFKREPISWELWQVIKGTPINKIDYTNYTVINDYTCDIDEPSDIYKFEGGSEWHTT